MHILLCPNPCAYSCIILPLSGRYSVLVLPLALVNQDGWLDSIVFIRPYCALIK